MQKRIILLNHENQNDGTANDFDLRNFTWVLCEISQPDDKNAEYGVTLKTTFVANSAVNHPSKSVRSTMNGLNHPFSLQNGSK